MKNKVTIGILAFFVLVTLTTGVTSAANKSNPWNEVWAAINELSEQVANIQLIPGPQGPEGPQGETGLQGVQGIQGEQGPPGTSITRSNVYQSSSPFWPVPSYGRQVQAVAACNDENDVALSGGFYTTHHDINVLASRQSTDTSGAAKWEVIAKSVGSHNGALMAYITCLQVE